MSTVGRMDGAFFVSRSELLGWANASFNLGLSKVEQCSNGAVYCQAIDACHPGNVAMKKVNWAARADHEAIPNYKVLQQAFDRCGIQKHVDVDKLIRGKYQDNLEMLQWIKTYFDRTYQGQDYEPLSRRFGDHHPDWVHSKDGGNGSAAAPSPQTQPAREREAPVKPSTGSRAPGSAPPPRRGGAASGNSVGSGGAPPRVPNRESPSRLGNGAAHSALEAEHEQLKEDHEKVREEIVDLKITVDGLETERDFYFQKLRDIEILCQALEAQPDPRMTVSKYVEDVQRILYAKDDEEEGDDDDRG
mmetsp:Transcript_44456/g.118034  ORF Transcript_44456/g.118034 Transcript_44456/m.118034 type:complete len:303 (-) Transcript_44456:120-1028(-)|eukprot:CAMPEP_0194504376 /NCGR_PEP_ID=MMETSP0253-20130528/28911_1 /TAXON_ID=2966 /ORGANISM="Noctiluca scintillans" /LENGTH=302 /DNA_ID=CAMNT_0039346757 /DNA_START=69 /DNA_END=977 /DNA_ORIENTATION=-